MVNNFVLVSNNCNNTIQHEGKVMLTISGNSFRFVFYLNFMQLNFQKLFHLMNVFWIKMLIYVDSMTLGGKVLVTILFKKYLWDITIFENDSTHRIRVEQFRIIVNIVGTTFSSHIILLRLFQIVHKIINC